MLNRNEFIEDVSAIFKDWIAKDKVREQANGIVASEDVYPPSKYLEDRFNFLSDGSWPLNIYCWDSGMSYSKTEYLLHLVYHFSPRDEGGFTEEEVNRLLKKHEDIISLVCTPSYAGLNEYDEGETNSELNSYEELLINVNKQNAAAIKVTLIGKRDFVALEKIANHLYQRWLRQDDFQMHREAIDFYQVLYAQANDSNSRSRYLFRISELCEAMLKQNKDMKLVPSLSEEEVSAYTSIKSKSIFTASAFNRHQASLPLSTHRSCYFSEEKVKKTFEKLADHFHLQLRRGS